MILLGVFRRGVVVDETDMMIFGQEVGEVFVVVIVESGHHPWLEEVWSTSVCRRVLFVCMLYYKHNI